MQRNVAKHDTENGRITLPSLVTKNLTNPLFIGVCEVQELKASNPRPTVLEVGCRKIDKAFIHRRLFGIELVMLQRVCNIIFFAIERRVFFMLLCDACIHSKVCVYSQTPDIFETAVCRNFLSKDTDKMTTRIIELIHAKAEYGKDSLPEEVYSKIYNQSIMFQNLDTRDLDLYVIPRTAREMNNDNVYVLIVGTIPEAKDYITDRIVEIENIVRDNYEIVAKATLLDGIEMENE